MESAERLCAQLDVRLRLWWHQIRLLVTSTRLSMICSGQTRSRAPSSWTRNSPPCLRVTSPSRHTPRSWSRTPTLVVTSATVSKIVSWCLLYLTVSTHASPTPPISSPTHRPLLTFTLAVNMLRLKELHLANDNKVATNTALTAPTTAACSSVSCHSSSLPAPQPTGAARARAKATGEVAVATARSGFPGRGVPLSCEQKTLLPLIINMK